MSRAPQHLRSAPSRRVRSWPQRLAITAGSLVSVLCVAVAAGVGFLYWKTGRFARAELSLDKVATGAPRNYLIVGSDSRANVDPSAPDAGAFLGGGEPTGQRSDTILVVRIDPAAGDVKLLSFPRDLWVPIAGTGRSAKINSAYGRGRQALIDTIRQDFGVEVNNYIEVDFKGFKGIVDAIGGVPLYFDTAMKDDNTGLAIENPGCVTLDGEQALAFARSRELEYRDAKGRWQQDPTADLGRITRQQILVRKAMTRALSLGITTNLKAFYDLLDTATKSVTFDQDIDRGDMKNLLDRFKAYRPEDMKTFSLPVTTGTSSDGQSILNLETGKAQPVLNVFRGVDPGPVLESDVTVDVQTPKNGTLRAKDVQSALDAVGFSEGRLANASSVPARTTIRYAPADQLAADLLSRHLSTTALLEPDPTLSAGRVVLVTGPDFTTVMQRPRPFNPVVVPTTAAPPSAAAPGTATTTVPATSTTVVGITPGETPAGVTC